MVDGKYTYLHGGPYDARDDWMIIGGRIVISALLIDELADELNNDCDAWAGRREYEPDYDDYP